MNLKYFILVSLSWALMVRPSMMTLSKRSSTKGVKQISSGKKNGPNDDIDDVIAATKSSTNLTFSNTVAQAISEPSTASVTEPQRSFIQGTGPQPSPTVKGDVPQPPVVPVSVSKSSAVPETVPQPPPTVTEPQPPPTVPVTEPQPPLTVPETVLQPSAVQESVSQAPPTVSVTEPQSSPTVTVTKVAGPSQSPSPSFVGPQISPAISNAPEPSPSTPSTIQVNTIQNSPSSDNVASQIAHVNSTNPNPNSIDPNPILIDPNQRSTDPNPISIDPNPKSSDPVTIPDTPPAVEKGKTTPDPSLTTNPGKVLTEQQNQEKLKEQTEKRQQKTLIIVVCVVVAIILLSAIGNFWYGRRKRDLKSNEELDDFESDKVSSKEKLQSERSFQYTRSNGSESLSKQNNTWKRMIESTNDNESFRTTSTRYLRPDVNESRTKQNNTWKRMIESTNDNESFRTTSTKYLRSDVNEYYNRNQNQFTDSRDKSQFTHSRNASGYDDESIYTTPERNALYQDRVIAPGLGRFDQRSINIPDPAVLNQNSIMMYSPITDFKYMHAPSPNFDAVESMNYEANAPFIEKDKEVEEDDDHEVEGPKRKNSKGLKLAMPDKNVQEKSILGLKVHDRVRLSNMDFPSASSRESKATVYNRIRLSNMPTPSASSIIW